MDKGHDVHQLSDEEKEDVPAHIKEAARKMGQEAYAKQLKEIAMSEHDAELYGSFSTEVAKEIKELKHVLFGLEAKAEERTWLRHQTDGDLDDNKLVESITGEHTVYKRRGVQDPMPGGPQQHPKRVRFVVDVSGSMYRFNGYDQRLNRMLQAICMVMESFDGIPEEKVVYDIVGHSGETPCMPFVTFDSRPQNEKDYLKVLRNMHAHSQFCMSGDHTVEATQQAIDAMAARTDSDERYVVILSDANLQRYGIPPRALGDVLSSASAADTKAFCIMIGSLGDEVGDSVLPRPAPSCLYLHLLVQSLQCVCSPCSMVPTACTVHSAAAGCLFTFFGVEVVSFAKKSITCKLICLTLLHTIHTNAHECTTVHLYLAFTSVPHLCFCIH